MQDIAITDPSGYVGSPWTRWLDQRLERTVRHPDDVALLRVPLLTAAILWPSVTALVLAGPFSWWWTLGYALLPFSLAGSFGSFMHEMAHSRFLKERWQFIYPCIEWGLMPLFGTAPYLYRALHIGMHHVENNGTGDYHSTLRVQRDSFASHFRLWLRIVLFTDVAVVRYLWAKRRRSFLRSASLGVAVYWAALFSCLMLNSQLALTIFVIPMVLIRFGAALNNSCEHLLIDPDQPGNLYRNSCICVNNPYNHSYFNGLYHATHHLRPSATWTQLPARFAERIAEYRQQQALIFSGVTHVGVFFLLVRKQYGALARHYLQDPDAPRTEAEIVDLLKYRSRRILAAPGRGSEHLRRAAGEASHAR